MKITVLKEAKKMGLRFDEVPVGSFYKMDGESIFYKLSVNQYLDFAFESISLQTMNALGNPTRIILPVGTKIEITV